MIEATLSVKLGESWIKDVLQKHNITIKFLGWMPAENKCGGKSLIEIKGVDGRLEHVSDSLRESPTVCNVNITKVGKGVLVGEVEVNRCSIYKAMADSDCFLTYGTTAGDGSLVLTIVSSDRKRIKEFVEKLEKDGCGVNIVSLRDPEKESLLTERQEEVLRSAYELGYFEYPKRISIKELSERLNLSVSTLSETLRKSEKKIIEAYFSGK